MHVLDKAMFATVKDMVAMLNRAISDAEQVAAERALTESEVEGVGRAAHAIEQAVVELEKRLPINA